MRSVIGTRGRESLFRGAPFDALHTRFIFRQRAVAGIGNEADDGLLNQDRLLDLRNDLLDNLLDDLSLRIVNHDFLAVFIDHHSSLSRG